MLRAAAEDRRRTRVRSAGLGPGLSGTGRLKALTSVFQRFNALVDWFIPVGMREDRTLRKQAQMFLVSHICGPFIGNSVPAAVYLLAPNPGINNVVLAASITGFWIFPILLKLFGHYNLLAILSIQNLMFCVIWSCLMLGGIQSPTVPWVLTIPLLSFFYLGSAPEIRVLVLAMFIANFAAFWLLSGDGSFEPGRIAPEVAEALGLVSTVAAALYVAMMALFYAKALATQGELEAESKHHLATALDLRRAAAAADRADSVKADFLARVSGEMRIPLHALIGYSSILVDEAEQGLSADTVDELKSIRSSGLECLRMVNDVVDLAKIETGRMEIFVDDFDPVELLRDVVAESTPAAEANGNRLSLHIDSDLDRLSSDMRKVRIILVQLLSNAAKFTSLGDIVVRARVAELDRPGAWSLVVDVSDTGTGIPAHRMAKLFEQFAVNDDASASAYGGSGLGLALSRKLCRLLGGDIECRPGPDAGTTFRFWIPTGAALAGQGEVQEASSGEMSDTSYEHARRQERDELYRRVA